MASLDAYRMCLKVCIIEDLSPLNCMEECGKGLESNYKAPLVWVGLYVAAASLVCMLVMATDLLKGLLTNKNWFPCNFFTLNAAISAVLAIALKIPVDLSTSIPCGRDQLIKLCGTTLMSVSMANFMPSLGAMSNAERVANLLSLAVFIVPLISNICIQIGTQVIYRGILVQHLIIIFCIILQFSFLVSIAIASATMKKTLNSAYKEQQCQLHKLGDDDLKKHWAMAHVSNPQFIIARSVISTASGAICLLSVLVLAEVLLQLYFTMTKTFFFFPNSDYDWSMNYIVLVQMAAVLVGCISPICRWFTVVWFKFSGWTESSFTDLWSIQDYWTERLQEFKNLQLGFTSGHLKLDKIISDGKDAFLDLVIKFQIFTVFYCKFLCFVSLVFFLPFLFLHKTIRRNNNNNKKKTADAKQINWDLNKVFKLDKEPVLSNTAVNKFLDLADRFINKAKKEAVSMNLIKLLGRAKDFDGLKEFNSTLVQRLTVMGVPYNPYGGNWAVMVITLSIIAYTIKSSEEGDQFVSMVNKILRYVRYYEKTVVDDVGQEEDMINLDLGDAAMNMWYSKEWRIKDNKLPIDETWLSSNLKTKLEKLKHWSEEYNKNNGKNRLRKETGIWMKKTVEAVIEFLESEKGKEIENDDQQMFDKMSRMVADILAASLANLSEAISKNMSSNSIEKREVAMKNAISIFVETREIRKFVEERLSSITASQDYKEYMEESWWRKVVLDQVDAKGSLMSSSLSTDDHHHPIEIHPDE